MTDEQLPTTNPVRVGRGYALYPDGSLWRRGAYPYRVGYVLNPPSFDAAVDAAEADAWGRLGHHHRRRRALT